MNTPVYEADLTAPVLLALGGEKWGTSRPLAVRADLLLRNPYGRSFAGSLGTAAAAAVTGCEIQRQRRQKGTVRNHE